MRMRYPLAAQTNASDAPVLPPVYSITVSPDPRRPSASAREITASAIRSFMLPVGFSHSSFTRMSAQSGGTTLRSRTSDVFPIALRMSTGALPRLSPGSGVARFNFDPATLDVYRALCRPGGPPPAASRGVRPLRDRWGTAGTALASAQVGAPARGPLGRGHRVQRIGLPAHAARAGLA